VRLVSAVEGEDVFLVERGERPDGSYMVVGDFTATSLDLKVFERGSPTPNTAVYTFLAQPVAGVVQTGLVVDGYWQGFDSIGYNFLLRILPSAYRFTGGKIYDAEVKLTGTFNALAWIKILRFQISVAPIGST
jgi:hypothetical protein